MKTDSSFENGVATEVEFLKHRSRDISYGTM